MIFKFVTRDFPVKNYMEEILKGFLLKPNDIHRYAIVIAHNWKVNEHFRMEPNGTFVLGVRVQYGSHFPQDLGLNSPIIASRNALGNLRKLLWSLEGIFETSEDTRLSNPDTWTFWYLLKFLPFVNHIRNRYHATAIYNCNPLFELASSPLFWKSKKN